MSRRAGTKLVLRGLDVIMLGPVHDNMHTVDEYMDMGSFHRVYGYLLKIMERMRD